MKNDYVDNKELTRILTEFHEERQENERLTLRMFEHGDYIGGAIIDICTNLANKSNFNGYTFKDEMIEDAIENCVRATMNFNPELSSNAFGYYTQIAFNAFIRRIKTEGKHRKKLLRVMSDSQAIDEIVNSQFDGDNESSEDAQTFINEIQSALLKNEQMIEIKPPPMRVMPKKEILSVFDEFL